MPFAESMISVVKSNKSIMLDKSKRFRKTQGGYGKNKKVEYDFPEATPEVLKEIKIKIKMEKRQLWIKVIILSMALIGGFIWMYFEL